jgi:sugar O-acyltransferase (sialic acid O-acetyltransferase NeuD family)
MRRNSAMVREILIYGAGGAGRTLAFSLSMDRENEISWRVKGFVDDTEKLWGKKINDIPVVGGSEYLLSFSGNVAVSIVDNPSVRKNIISKVKQNKKIKFPYITSSKALVSPFVQIGEGCIISPLDNIQPNSQLGDFVWINGATRIGHDVVIAEYSTIFSGILISGGVTIGSGCVIGSGAIILPKRKIGDGSIIGAGSVINRDIPPNVVAAGVPAKVIRKIK